MFAGSVAMIWVPRRTRKPSSLVDASVQAIRRRCLHLGSPGGPLARQAGPGVVRGLARGSRPGSSGHCQRASRVAVEIEIRQTLALAADDARNRARRVGPRLLRLGQRRALLARQIGQSCAYVLCSVGVQAKDAADANGPIRSVPTRKP